LLRYITSLRRRLQVFGVFFLFIFFCNAWKISVGFKKLREDAVLPIRATKYSAGYDLSSVEDEVIVFPGETKLVRTGLAAYMLPDEELQIRSRSGLALKQNVFVLNAPGTVDSDFYPNEIGVIIRNEDERPFRILKYDRIAQGVFAKYLVVDNDEPRDSIRYSGFGSTGGYTNEK
jgi:dUTP pyrophosphatase